MTNEEMAVAIQQGRKDLIAPLWEQTQRFFAMIAGQCYAKFYERAQRYGVTEDDLKQVAFLGLLDMVKAYDPAAGYKLTTYAQFACRNQFAVLLGFRARRQSKDPINNSDSLDEPISAEHDSPKSDFVPDPTAPLYEVIESVWQRELREAEEQALQTLDERRAGVIRDIYFSNITLRELSEKYGVSLARVGQLKAEALQNLRQGNALRILRPFHDDVYMSLGLRGVGFTAFSHGGSATERAIESLERWSSEWPQKDDARRARETEIERQIAELQERINKRRALNESAD